jgi:hypothetical protein
LEPRPWHSAAHRACRNQSNIHPRLSNTKQPEHALRDHALPSLSIRWASALGHKRTYAVQSSCPLYPRKQTFAAEF